MSRTQRSRLERRAAKHLLAISSHSQAQLAYSIIESLLEHTTIISDLIALMARTLDQDTTKALTQHRSGLPYLESRRSMEHTRADVESLPT